MQIEFRAEPRDLLCNRVTAERSGGNHGDAFRDLGDFFPDDRHHRMLLQGFGNLPGEGGPVHGQCAAGGDLGVVRRAHHQ